MKKDTQELMLVIGRNIKYYRELNGLSREELAQKAGYKNRSSIAKIEAGETRVQAFKMIDFANALGVEVYELMHDHSKDNVKELFTETANQVRADISDDKFKQCISILLRLNQEETEKAYTVLSTMFGG